jgi:hypothetical protein
LDVQVSLISVADTYPATVRFEGAAGGKAFNDEIGLVIALRTADTPKVVGEIPVLGIDADLTAPTLL